MQFAVGFSHNTLTRETLRFPPLHDQPSTLQAPSIPPCAIHRSDLPCQQWSSTWYAGLTAAKPNGVHWLTKILTASWVCDVLPFYWLVHFLLLGMQDLTLQTGPLKGEARAFTNNICRFLHQSPRSL